jgi:hypothetical protein
VPCGFCVKSTTYLGFVLSRDGISIDKQKQSAVLDAPFPTIAKALHRLLGAAVWLSRVLLCNLSNLTAPLRKFLLQGPHGKSHVHPYDPSEPVIRRTVGAPKERIANAVLLHPPGLRSGGTAPTTSHTHMSPTQNSSH